MRIKKILTLSFLMSVSSAILGFAGFAFVFVITDFSTRTLSTFYGMMLSVMVYITVSVAIYWAFSKIIILCNSDKSWSSIRTAFLIYTLICVLIALITKFIYLQNSALGVPFHAVGNPFLYIGPYNSPVFQFLLSVMNILSLVGIYVALKKYR